MTAPLDPAGRRRRAFGPDLLRALAVLMVVTCHAGALFFNWFGGAYPWQAAVSGFFGVELFFVLSGYLIGALLLELLDARPGRRDWAVFLVRRWMRTLPAYWFWLAVLLLFWAPIGISRRHAAVLFTPLWQNLAWPQVAGWFGVSWSLAVEEWFYLLFPLALAATMAAATASRRPAGDHALPSRSWRVMPPVLAVFLLVPPLLRWQLPETVSWDRVTSQVVVFRLDAIAFGVLAIWLERLLRPSARVLAGCGIAGLALLALVWTGRIDRVVHWGPHLRHTLLFDAGSTAFALLMGAAARLPDPPAWLLHPVRVLSERSYALYLVHLSVMEWVGYAMANHHWSPVLAVALSVAGMAVLPALSWRLLEAPILRRRPPQRTAPPIPGPLAAADPA
ncbi:acyltransferase family protein [Rhizosaccharibacter radicis]|uniref:Acyltransferase n=1 Tax=Rhizosaccharibacter radicis TaxID=2782605 RepID=A0ABT1W1Q9_9PROT|nr:acyltransferase [Acetobacteraceae bacterium KSS12]